MRENFYFVEWLRRNKEKNMTEIKKILRKLSYEHPSSELKISDINFWAPIVYHIFYLDVLIQRSSSFSAVIIIISPMT